MITQLQVFSWQLVSVMIICLPGFAHALRTAYIDEATYLNDLAAQGYAPIHESFENDTAWGPVRGTTEPNITNLGVTWTSNYVNGEITTGSGPARTGDWGFYALPHNPLGDGFIGTSNDTLYGVGGWFVTNTPVAKLGLVLDGNELDPVDFGEICEIVDEEEVNCVDLNVTNEYGFYGVIDTDGFGVFEFSELEGTSEDQKLIFSDDFVFGIVPPACTITTIGDINLDCRVDNIDLTRMSFNWLIAAIDCPPNFPVGDLNSDCEVNFLDYSKIALHWLDCNLSPPESCWQ
jgi:hypothetical protein